MSLPNTLGHPPQLGDVCPTKLRVHHLRLCFLLSVPYQISDAMACLEYWYPSLRGVDWIGLFCLALGINSIVWNHNTVSWAPVWCDITSRLSVGFPVGLPAVILSINRRLYFLASPTSLLHSKADKRHEIMVDLAIGIGLPILEMIFYFFAQANRFGIFEDYGCSPAQPTTWVRLVVITFPPILLELISGVYGCLSIYAFYKRRPQMNGILSSHDHNLNSNRYIRLMCFSACDLLTSVPFTVLYLYMNISSGLAPFLGLKQEHYHFKIFSLPAVLWRATMTSELDIELNRWIAVWCEFVFFAIFGFTKESRDNYRASLQIIVQYLVAITGIKSRTSSKTKELTFKAATRDLPLETVNSDIERTLA